MHSVEDCVYDARGDRTPGAGLCGLLLAAALVASTMQAAAQAPQLTVIHKLAVTYHEEPARLDDARSDLERVVKMDPDPSILVALARISYIWGDVRAGTQSEKLNAYDRGRQVARQALDLAPGNVDARYWYAVNTGRWAETKGLFSALYLLPTIKAEIQAVLDLDPRYVDAYGFTGNLYDQLPRLLGGDVELAEQMFRKGLALDPMSTGLRVGLARVLIRTGRAAEARRERQRVIEETTPRNPAEWNLRDTKAARTLLESVERQSR